MMDFTYNHSKFKFRRKELRANGTKAEDLLWEKLRQKKLGLKFFRQYSVGPCVLDFYCPEIRFAIELDGAHHQQGEQVLYDEERTKYLKERDIEVLRIKNQDIMKDINSVTNIVEVLCGRAKAMYGVPPLKVRGGRGSYEAAEAAGAGL